MKPENIVKIMLDFEATKKLQNELPSRLQVLLVSIIQFFTGCSILSWAIYLSKTMDSLFITTIVLMLGVFVILMSAYTYFGYIFRKKHLILLQALLSQNNDDTTSD